MEGGPGKIFGLRQGGPGFIFVNSEPSLTTKQNDGWQLEITGYLSWVFCLLFRGEKITKSACFRTSFVLGIWLCIITCCILFYRVLSFSLNCMKIPAWPLKPRFEDGEFALWKLFLILWLLRLRPVLKIKNPRQSFVLYDIYCFSISFLWCY